MLDTIPLFIGGMPGGMELAVILLIAVLLFGANKIPKLARSTGQAMGEFQKGREEIEQELDEIREGPQSQPEEATTTESAVATEGSESESSSAASTSTEAEEE